MINSHFFRFWGLVILVSDLVRRLALESIYVLELGVRDQQLLLVHYGLAYRHWLVNLRLHGRLTYVLGGSPRVELVGVGAVLLLVSCLFLHSPP